MNDKVEELVEEVDELLRDVFRHYNKGEMVSTEKVAKQILSHPDLYLQITGEPIIKVDMGAGEESYSAVDYIPLAEAMKEVSNDTD